MKAIIYLLLIVTLLIILFVIVPQDKVPVIKKVNNVEIAAVDGCEYIVNRTYAGSVVYTHKGNCTNSIHMYRKE